jgi:hypothetical protein
MVKSTPFLDISIKLNVDLKTADEWLADFFLWGDSPPTFGRIKRRYPKPGDEEREALQALLRVLKSEQPLSRTLRNRLAELFDPDSTKAERHLKIKFRRSGHQSQQRQDAQIARYVSFQEKKHGKNEAAIRDAQTRFELSRSKIFEALNRHKKRVPKSPA